jgi:hypothetical protein
VARSLHGEFPRACACTQTQSQSMQRLSRPLQLAVSSFLPCHDIASRIRLVNQAWRTCADSVMMDHSLWSSVLILIYGRQIPSESKRSEVAVGDENKLCCSSHPHETSAVRYITAAEHRRSGEAVIVPWVSNIFDKRSWFYVPLIVWDRHHRKRDTSNGKQVQILTSELANWSRATRLVLHDAWVSYGFMQVERRALKAARRRFKCARRTFLQKETESSRKWSLQESWSEQGRHCIEQCLVEVACALVAHELKVAQDVIASDAFSAKQAAAYGLLLMERCRWNRQESGKWFQWARLCFDKASGVSWWSRLWLAWTCSLDVDCQWSAVGRLLPELRAKAKLGDRLAQFWYPWMNRSRHPKAALGLLRKLCFGLW